jgi:hypothetical protein
MCIPPLSASRSSARLVALSTTMMNYILRSGGKTQACTSDPRMLTMKRQVAQPYTISLSVSRSSARLVAPSTTMMNYILRSGGKTQARTSDVRKLKMKRRVAPPSASFPSIHPTFYCAPPSPLRLCVSLSFDLLAQCLWFHDCPLSVRLTQHSFYFAQYSLISSLRSGFFYNFIDAITCNTKSIGSTRCESTPWLLFLL